MSKYSVLLIENDIKTVQEIQSIFIGKDQDITFITSNNSSMAIDMVWKRSPDLILAGTPVDDINTIEMIGILKKNQLTKDIPIIMLGADTGYEEEIRALDVGANDYIRKPIVSEVLKLRIKNFIKSSANRAERIEQDEILESGNIVLNITSHIAYLNKKELTLTPKEFALLYLFIKKKNKVLNRVFLSETIWENKYSNTSHTIDKHIANLRKKLGKEGCCIETLPTVGYKFIENNKD